jgi:cold shock CspA family protein
VSEWNAVEGWGVLLTSQGLTVWCHYSQLAGPGYKEPKQGDRITFDYETLGQDGCDGRVLNTAQLKDQP